jgi:excinuclease ABC subunit A
MKSSEIATLEPKKNILIKGAEIHNLKKIDVVIPRNELVVITGLSGSGKSSLAFDTLYAEGQRRYVESLSSYARQFLGRLDKPKVEYIKGIAPAIAIEQKVNTTNARSTVGTSTEIYDYLKLLYARIGKTISPISGKEVKKETVSDVVTTIKTFAIDSKWLLLAPIYLEKGRTMEDKLKVLQQQGFARVLIDNEMVRLDEYNSELNKKKEIILIIDRIIIKDDEAFFNRLADAVQSFFEGKGICFLQDLETNKRLEFSTNFEFLTVFRFLNQTFTYLVSTILMELVLLVKVMEILLELTKNWLFQIHALSVFRKLFFLGVAKVWVGIVINW